MDAIKPGILELALDSFAIAYPNQDAKTYFFIVSTPYARQHFTQVSL